MDTPEAALEAVPISQDPVSPREELLDMICHTYPPGQLYPEG